MENVSFDTPFPIGKYRGQPLEVVIRDSSYMEWFAAQANLVERYSAIVDFYRSGPGKAGEDCTPDHNAMQIKFLDADYCLRVFEALNPKYAGGEAVKGIAPIYGRSGLATMEYRDELGRTTAQFEVQGWDVVLRAEILRTTTEGGKDPEESDYWDISVIELKPTIGDDFPAVLRQVKKNRARLMGVATTSHLRNATPVVYTRAITATNVTPAQIKAFFASEGVQLLIEDEINAAADSWGADDF